MVVCPQCGCPQEEDTVIGERDHECQMCSWFGSSSELVQLEDNGKFQDPRVFVEFMLFLQRKVSPMVAGELKRLGLVSGEATPSNIRHITILLINFSRAGFKAVLEGVLGASNAHEH